MVSWALLVAAAGLATGAARTVTISNLHPRLDIDGNVINSHDGTVSTQAVCLQQYHILASRSTLVLSNLSAQGEANL